MAESLFEFQIIDLKSAMEFQGVNMFYTTLPHSKKVRWSIQNI